MGRGGRYVKGLSKTFNIIALSSGESELGGLVRACAEGLGMQSILRDYGFDIEVRILSDATAAIGMARRCGLGKVRHLATADLWVQQKVRTGQIMVAKHPGTSNPADLMTKYKTRSEIFRQISLMGFRALGGRPKVSPSRSPTWSISQPVTVPGKGEACCEIHEVGVSDGSCCLSGLDLSGSMVSVFFEGNSLCPNGPLPNIENRTLLSLLDLNTGEWLYDRHTMPSRLEPDFRTMIDPATIRPMLLATWTVDR